MPSYLAPGVYVEEVQSGPRPIQSVGTETAGFIGEAPQADAHVDQAIAINNWTQFTREFASSATDVATPLALAVEGFFVNGGRRCFVVNVGKRGSIAGGVRKRQGIQVLETVDEVAIVAAPSFIDIASYEALLSHCESLKDRVAILDPPEVVDRIDALVTTMTDTTGGATEPPGAGGALKPRQSAYAAFYFPRIRVRDPFSGKIGPAPPSGHLAGVYARSDATRGVHKAPANEPIRGALTFLPLPGSNTLIHGQ